MVLNVIIDSERRAVTVKNASVVTDNSDYTVRFTLAEDAGFDPAEEMTALFITTRGTQEQTFIGNSCSLPTLLSSDYPTLRIGLTQGEIRTTTDASFRIIKSAASIGTRPILNTPASVLPTVDTLNDGDYVQANSVSLGRWVKLTVANLAAKIKQFIGRFGIENDGLVPHPDGESVEEEKRVLFADGTWHAVRSDVLYATINSTDYTEIEDAIAEERTCIATDGTSYFELVYFDGFGVVFEAMNIQWELSRTGQWSRSSLIDNEPIEGSENTVKSGGVYSAILAQKTVFPVVMGETTYEEIKAAYLADKLPVLKLRDEVYTLNHLYDSDAEFFLFVPEAGGSVAYLPRITRDNVWHNREFDFHTADETDDALRLKQDKLVFDPFPMEGSSNALTSGAIYQALYNLQHGIEPMLDAAQKIVTTSGGETLVVQID